MSTPDSASRPSAVNDHFRSIDSAPAGISVDRPASATNGFLIVFAAVSIIAMSVHTIAAWRGLSFAGEFLVFADDRSDTVPIRMFISVFFLVYASFAYGNRWRRVVLALSLLGKFLIVCLIVDGAAWLLEETDLLAISPFGQEMLSGLFALPILPHTILRQAQLPEQRRTTDDPYTPRSAYLTLAIAITASITAAIVALVFFGDEVRTLRAWAIIGGIGPGIFLVQQVFALTTAGVGWLKLRRMRTAHFTPPIAVVVPAHNEAHHIAETIASVDRAARTYPGSIHLCIVDNASTDATIDVARRALADCELIDGEVLECPRPGKAIALNQGIATLPQDFIVRIDADTVIGPHCLERAMRHFTDPRVGAVGGMPLPAAEKTWIDKVRLVEVLLRHGFFQLSLTGYRGVLAVPGMFTAYRKEALNRAGPMVQGMNGEDTDICVRISGAGYRTVADPSAVYHSETPDSYEHLREQRVRWFRSIYHVAAHNRGVLFDRRSMSGTFVLPFQLFNAGRRAMLAPLLLFVALAEIIFRATFNELMWQPIVATVIGMPMIIAVLVCLLMQPRALLYVPAYLCFRVLRSYFTLAAALSLRFPPVQPRELARSARWPARRRTIEA